MKLHMTSIFIFTWISFSLFADPTIRIEPLTPEKMKLNPELKKLDDYYDKGFQKYLFSGEEIPDEEIYFSVARPTTIELFPKSEAAPFSTSKNPGGIISAKGFFPGEKIQVHFQSKDSTFQYDTELIPFPLRSTSNSKDFSIEAELLILYPTTYIIRLEGVNEGEVLKMKSKSYSEQLIHDQEYSNKNLITFSPGVIGKKGGLANLSYTTQSGKSVSINIPWGTRLFDDYVKLNYKN